MLIDTQCPAIEYCYIAPIIVLIRMMKPNDNNALAAP
jgi:hypothetical protein